MAGTGIGLLMAFKYAGKNKAMFRDQGVLKVCGGILVAILTVGGALSVIFPDSPSTSVARNSSGSKPRKRHDEGYLLGNCMRTIKNNLKDPGSFNYIQHALIDDGILVKYRAKNGFGGYVVNHQTCSG